MSGAKLGRALTTDGSGTRLEHSRTVVRVVLVMLALPSRPPSLERAEDPRFLVHGTECMKIERDSSSLTAMI